MVELNGVRIWAVLAGASLGTPARKLVCGTLARPLAEGEVESAALPTGAAIPERLAVPGRPELSVRWTGWFELLTGEVVGVYGATVERVG